MESSRHLRPSPPERWKDASIGRRSAPLRSGIEPEISDGGKSGRVIFPPNRTIHCSALNEKGGDCRLPHLQRPRFQATGTAGVILPIHRRWAATPISTSGPAGRDLAPGGIEHQVAGASHHRKYAPWMSPQEAGMDALKRIARTYNNEHEQL